MKIQEAEISLSNGSKFIIYHNLGNQLNAALENWIVRTNCHTAQSLCDYINGKRLNGLTDHVAITQERWNEIQIEISNKKKA